MGYATSGEMVSRGTMMEASPIERKDIVEYRQGQALPRQTHIYAWIIQAKEINKIGPMVSISTIHSTKGSRNRTLRWD